MPMKTLLLITLTLILGSAGAYLGNQFKIPAGSFLGPILFIGAFQIIFTPLIERPSWLRLVIQIAVGVTLGTSFSKIPLSALKKLVLPTLTISFIMVSGGILVGFTLWWLSDWDPLTSILAAAPGGQAEMALLSDAVGARTEKVIILQLLRNQLVVLGMVPMARLIVTGKRKSKVEGDEK